MGEKKKPSDFTFGPEIGQGSYSIVLKALEISTQKEFAVIPNRTIDTFQVKILDKRQIIREKKVKYVTVEKEVLNKLNHELVIKLFYTFQDEHSLYFVLEYAPRGDLLGLLKTVGKMNREACQFYIGQLIEAVSYLHRNGILHRDIKPENILLDERNYIKLADFGSALIQSLHSSTDNNVNNLQNDASQKDHQRNEIHKLEGKERLSRKASFVGTAEYCCPELLNDRAISEKSDIWSIGVVLFQLLSGKHPFRGSTEYQTFQKILFLEYSFPLEMDEICRNLFRNIFVLDPCERYSELELRKDSFFESCNFSLLYTMNAPNVLVLNHSRGASTSSALLLHDDDEEQVQENEEDSDEEDSQDTNQESLESFVKTLPRDLPSSLQDNYPQQLFYGIIFKVSCANDYL